MSKEDIQKDHQGRCCSASSPRGKALIAERQRRQESSGKLVLSSLKAGPAGGKLPSVMFFRHLRSSGPVPGGPGVGRWGARFDRKQPARICWRAA